MTSKTKHSESRCFHKSLSASGAATHRPNAKSISSTSLTCVRSSATVRPLRLILYLFIAVGQLDLLGSEYHTTHPTVPTARLSDSINLDSVDIFGRDRYVQDDGL